MRNYRFDNDAKYNAVDHPKFLVEKGDKWEAGVLESNVNNVDGSDSREDVGDVGCDPTGQAHEGQTNVKILNKESPHKCGSCRMVVSVHKIIKSYKRRYPHYSLICKM